MIYHITARAAWEVADTQYTAPSLETEGFLHASRDDQVVATANLYYRGQAGLIVLEIDPEGLDVRWEGPAMGVSREGLFPHIYEALPVTSVIRVLELVETGDGFVWSP